MARLEAVLFVTDEPLPLRYARRIHYQIGSTESLKFPDGTFDVVVFSWVL